MKRIGALAVLLAALLVPLVPPAQAATTSPSPVGGWVRYSGIPARPMTAATTGYCTLHGCWYRTDAAHAEWDSQVFTFGYGGKVLGTGFSYVKWTLNGSNMRAAPVRYQVSTYTTHAYFDGSVRNGAPGVANGGSVLSRGFSTINGAAPAHTWRYWQPVAVGYGSRNVGTWDKNMTTYMYWSLSNYPGHWYTYARSIVAHATSAARTNYYFEAVNRLPGSPEGGGWIA